MANIFNFPLKKGAVEDTAFAPDTSELVQFDAPEPDTSASAQTPSSQSQHSSKDWSNQDLASIYRVKRLLNAAGVPNHVERSLSDEGDPWCVFCTEAGEVFIHLCRINGLYVLDSPNLSEPIRGVDFNDLIARFSEDAMRDTEKAAKARCRLIKLERGGKVFLHPAALLAALIWSIYLNSGDIVLFMPDEEGEDGFGSDAAIALVQSSANELDTDDAAAEAHFIQSVATPHELVSAELPETSGDAFATRPMHFYKDLAAKGGIALIPSAMAVGLSSIAIAYGFMSESYFGDEPAGQAEIDLGIAVDLDLQLAAPAPEDHNPTAPQAFDLAAVLDAVFDHVIPGHPEQDELPVLTESAAKIDVASLLGVTLIAPKAESSVSDFGDVLPYSDLPKKPGRVELILPEASVTPESSPNGIITSKPSVESPDTQIARLLPLAPEYFSISVLKDTFLDRLTEFSLGNTQFKASFDIASLADTTSQIFDPTLSLEEPMDLLNPDPHDQLLSSTQDVLTSFFQRPENPNLIDGNAISFIFYLMNKDEDVQIIAHDDEIVLIDFAAFEATRGDLLTMSWDLEHGGTVQTIGLKADFMAFDLIA